MPIQEQTNHRYHSVIITLHWLMAAGVFFMLASGLFMVYADMPKAEQYKLFQIHKASGVIMLWAIGLRLLCKFICKKPTKINQLNDRQQQHARWGHFVLYALLSIIPLSGWLMVSASPFGLPTLVFVEWINWPHVPGVARNKLVESISNNTHWLSTWFLAFVLCAHIGAVFWHKKIHKVNLLKRMWWTKNEDNKNA